MNPIELENRRVGTRDWLIPKCAARTDELARIEGFCSRPWVATGDGLEIYVNSSGDSDWSVDIFRMGYYGGDGGRLVHRSAALSGVDRGQARPERAAVPWESDYHLDIPSDWTTGYYLGKLTHEQSGTSSYVVFVVVGRRKAQLAVQASDYTWQAYNPWPADSSLYDGDGREWYFGTQSAVSLQRPYGVYPQLVDAPQFRGSGEFLLWEFPFVYWLESHGYDVTYTSNSHLDAVGADALSNADTWVSVGHDEYYTLGMFEALSTQIERGLNAAFFSGNTAFGRVAVERGAAGRTLRRVDVFVPRDERFFEEKPEMQALPFDSPDGADLVGAASEAPIMGASDWTCVDPKHWVFEGTEMASGEGIPGLVGWECHGRLSPLRNPHVLATGDTIGEDGEPAGHYYATLYEGERGNLVFNASTIWWADGLSEPPGYVRSEEYILRLGPDCRVQRMTTNILDRMINRQVRR